MCVCVCVCNCFSKTFFFPWTLLPWTFFHDIFSTDSFPTQNTQLPRYLGVTCFARRSAVLGHGWLKKTTSGSQRRTKEVSTLCRTVTTPGVFFLPDRGDVESLRNRRLDQRRPDADPTTLCSTAVQSFTKGGGGWKQVLVIMKNSYRKNPVSKRQKGDTAGGWQRK